MPLPGYLVEVLAPLAVSAFPVFYLFANNLSELLFADIWRSLIVIQAGTLLLLGILGLVYRNLTKAAFATSVIVFVFFAHGALYEVSRDFLKTLQAAKEIRKNLGTILLLVELTTIVVVMVALGFRAKDVGSLRRTNRVFALLAIVLIAANLVDNGVQDRLVSSANVSPTFDLVVDDLNVDATEQLPDIYYILLDGYSGNSTLLEQYGFDNSEFTDALEQRGFYVAYESRFNYCTTFLALPTVLNMQYLDFLAENPGKDSNDPTIPYMITDDNVVWRTLEPLGYRFVHFRTHHGATRENQLADYDLSPGSELDSTKRRSRFLVGLSEFEYTLGETTMLRERTERLRSREEELRRREARESQGPTARRAAVTYTYSTLAEIPEIDEPTFTFAHIGSPHPPFVFEANEGPVAPGGTPVDGEVVDMEKYEPNAEEMSQFIYVNRMTTQLVDQILANSDTPPIIVIQADHGQRPRGSNNQRIFQEGPDAVATYALHILSAFYVPEDVKEHLYPSITPVNTFRVIFDYEFGADLGLLEDRSICFPSRNRPYNFYEFE